MRSLQSLLRLDGLTALITGGTGHIALAVAETWAEQGARIVVTDRDPTACEARAADLASRFGIEAHGLPCDLGDPTSTSAMLRAVLERTGGALDLFAHTAGYTGMSGLAGYAVPFDEQTLEAWEASMRVNLSSAFQLVHEAREPLARSGRGAVVLVSSIYGVVGPNLGLYEGTRMGNPAAYAASKGGLVQLVRYLSTVMAPRVRVNAVSPGGIARGQAEAFVGRYEKLTPLGRMGVEEDLKGVMALLASDAGAWITGQNVMVDGGWTTW
jgi:NAD(P)-dependent dehydrogenase (short-subunit alcohol dehydrogenase family)